MRTVIVVACLALLTGPAAAEDAAAAPGAGSTGAGVVLGDPTGVTLKHFLHRTFAFDAGIGFSGDAAFYADALWYAWDLFPQPGEGRIGAYLGAGPRLETKRDPEFGLRTVAGVSYFLPRHPIELFLEAGPVFGLSKGAGTDVDAGVGLRLYWGPRGGP